MSYMKVWFMNGRYVDAGGRVWEHGQLVQMQEQGLEIKIVEVDGE